MEKDSKKEKVEKKKRKLTDTQKEILLTIAVLIICIIVGIFLGRLLYQTMYGPL